MAILWCILFRVFSFAFLYHRTNAMYYYVFIIWQSNVLPWLCRVFDSTSRGSTGPRFRRHTFSTAYFVVQFLVTKMQFQLVDLRVKNQEKI